MQSITLRLQADTIESLDEEADDRGVSRSEYVREVIRSRNDHDRIRDEYEERIADLERENERLKSEKRALIEDREERQQLVKYVEDELSYREAGLGTRMKWWLFGKDEA